MGLERDNVQRKTRIASEKTQRRLRELVEIIDKIEPRFGSAFLRTLGMGSSPSPVLRSDCNANAGGWKGR